MAEQYSTPDSRQCKKCGKVKPASCFYRQKNKIGIAALCKPCYIERSAKWKAENKERAARNNRRWADANRDSELRRKLYWSKHKRPDTNQMSDKQREAARRRARVSKRKMRSDARFRAFDNIRRAILYALRGERKNERTFALLGYRSDDLCLHLEKQFLPGMSWENYGDWHIDHIVPVSSFDFSAAPEDSLRACWALTNLRPLWGDENVKKSNKITHLI